MIWSIAADLVLLLHLAFIVFALFGGTLVLRWRCMLFLHLPAAAWAVLIEFAGWYCPLTPLENHFLSLAGEAGYAGGFIAHYLLPVIYPPGLTREVQVVLGAIALLVNVLIYGWVVYRWRQSKRLRSS